MCQEICTKCVKDIFADLKIDFFFDCSELVSMLATKERGYDGAVCIFGLKVEFEAQCKAFVLI